MMKIADVDIDLQTTFDPHEVFPTATRASIIRDGSIQRHPAGVYLENIPTDPISGLAAIPYDDAARYGYTKIDFLHLNILNDINSRETIRKLIAREPDWDMLLDKDIVEGNDGNGGIFHLSKHYKLLLRIAPRSIEELADCLALIRPSKQQYVNKYLNDKSAVRKYLYDADDKYYLKKPHAIAYAHNIVLQLHLRTILADQK